MNDYVNAADIQQHAERFLQVGDRTIPLNEVLKKFGAEQGEELYLCQRTPAGVMRACVSACEGDPYPGIDVDLVVPLNDTLPILLSRSEQPIRDGVDCPVRTFLYNRDTYIAYADADTRSDDAFETDPHQTQIVISGDSGSPEQTVHAYSENPYVKFMGSLPAEKE